MEWILLVIFTIGGDIQVHKEPMLDKASCELAANDILKQQEVIDAKGEAYCVEKK